MPIRPNPYRKMRPGRPRVTPTTKLPIVLPGLHGLHTQSEGAILDPRWSTVLSNTVINGRGQVAARNGWTSVTTGGKAEVSREPVHVNKVIAMGDDLIGVSESNVWVSSDGGDSWSDATGTAVFTDDNWRLDNFKDLVVGFQEGENMLVYDDGSASQESTSPTSGIGAAAFGRVWMSDADGQELKCSGLMDETDWDDTDASADSYVFSLESVWPNQDSITAIAQHNNRMVVFGQRNIVIYEDGSGSDIGIDPSNMVVVDTIGGIGTIDQETVNEVNGDLWFLTTSGELYSLQRTIQEQSAPLVNLARHISDALRDELYQSDFDIKNLRCFYSHRHRMYIISFSHPGVNNTKDFGRAYVMDTRYPLEDGTLRCMGRWTQNIPVGNVELPNGDLAWTRWGYPGEIGTYSGWSDGGEPYEMQYRSGWLRLEHEDIIGRLLFLKKISGVFMSMSTTPVVFDWAFDFSNRFQKRPAMLSQGAVAANSEWGTAEWGVSEWSARADLLDEGVTTGGSGEYVKIGLTADISNEFAIQLLNIYTRVGRLL